MFHLVQYELLHLRYLLLYYKFLRTSSLARFHQLGDMPLHIVPVVSVEEYVLMLLLFVDNFLLFLIQHFHPFLLCCLLHSWLCSLLYFLTYQQCFFLQHHPHYYFPYYLLHFQLLFLLTL